MADIYPESRVEEILVATIDGTEYTEYPQSRIEQLLIELKAVIEAGGGGGGTTNYNLLINKPEIAGVELSGNKSLSDLGITQEIKKVMDMLAGQFDPTETYEEGKIVVYNKTLYVFTTDHAAGEFNPLEVEQTDMDRILAAVYNVIPTDLSDLDDDSTHRTVADTEKSEWNGKQDALTFDNTPTASSTNPVTSDGIQKAITATAKTVSGNPIVIQDAANVSAESLKLTLEPIQSGTGDPSPTNIRPISGRTEVNLGRTGKNLIPLIEANAYNSDGTTYTTANRCRTPIIKVTSGTYALQAASTVSGKTLQTRYALWKNNSYTENELLSESQWVNDASYSFTLAEDTYISVTFRYSDNANISASDLHAQLEIGSTATPYEEYKGQTLTIALGTTVYGGTLNVKTGVLTITKALVDLGTLNWQYSADTGYERMITDAELPNAAKPSASSEQADILCSIYKADTYSNVYLHTSDNIIALNTGGRVSIYSTTMGTDASAFKTAVTGQIICYELATPETIQLTGEELALLKGYNYVTADGDMVLSYQPDNNTGDIKSWTEQKIQSASEALDTSKVDNSVVGTVENGTTASKAYAVGEHFIRNKKFCTAIAAIASGASFTLNTNFVESDISGWLQAKTVTVSAGDNISVNSNTNVCCVNGVVCGSIRLNITGVLTTGQVICTLSEAPKATVYAIAIGATTSDAMPVIIGYDGKVYLFGTFVPSQSENLMIPISYSTVI